MSSTRARHILNIDNDSDNDNDNNDNDNDNDHSNSDNNNNNIINKKLRKTKIKPKTKTENFKNSTQRKFTTKFKSVMKFISRHKLYFLLFTFSGSIFFNSLNKWFMNIGVFPYAMMWSLVIFVEPGESDNGESDNSESECCDIESNSSSIVIIVIIVIIVVDIAIIKIINIIITITIKQEHSISTYPDYYDLLLTLILILL